MARFRMTRRAVERIAENRIREAMAAGEFDNLPGQGKPIPGIDDPYDPLWWVKSWVCRARLAEALRMGHALDSPARNSTPQRCSS